MKVVDIASTIAPDRPQLITGIRPGEKLHEQMIGYADAPYTFDYSGHYKILPQINNWYRDPQRIKNGQPVGLEFEYVSDKNSDWMTTDDLKKWLRTAQMQSQAMIPYARQNITRLT